MDLKTYIKDKKNFQNFISMIKGNVTLEKERFHKQQIERQNFKLLLIQTILNKVRSKTTKREKSIYNTDN